MITVSDIVDTMIENGYHVFVSPERHENLYLDHRNRICCAMGALALKAGIPLKRDPGFITHFVDSDRLALDIGRHYGVSDVFVRGVECGFENNRFVKEENMGDGDYKAGYLIGLEANKELATPPREGVTPDVAVDVSVAV